MKTSFKLILVDTNPEMIGAWKNQHVLSTTPMVEIIQSDFRELKEYDCLVSVANSFGLMDGGADLAVSEFFGWSILTRVQEMILENWCGEQPVGTSMIVPTDNKEHPWLAHTPTMRCPIDIRGTDHVYVAMWAMLNAVHQHNLTHQIPEQIKTIACPGLGTGFGRMKFTEAARQMALAWKNYQERVSVVAARIQQLADADVQTKNNFDKTKAFYRINWETASRKHREVGAGGTSGFLKWFYDEFPDLEEIIYDYLLSHKS